MSFQPVRFIHAANAALDTHVRTTESLSDIEQQFLEDARDHALEHVVDSCVRRKVDFLLLSGDTFDERARSLRSRIALREAFDRLNEHAIQVFVIPDRTNPADAWRAMPLLPRNVTICDAWSHEPVAVLRDNKVIATVSNGLPVEEADEFGIQLPTDTPVVPERQHFRVGVCRYRPDAIADSEDGDEASNASPLTLKQQTQRFFDDSECNYAILTGLNERTTIKFGDLVAHCPGRTQPDSGRATEDGACSLIEVKSAGEVRVARIDTAAVAFHSLEIDAAVLRQEDEVISRMRAALQAVDRKPSHRMWLVNWTLRVSAELLPALEHPERRATLVAKLQGRTATDEALATAHVLRVVPDAASLGHDRPTAAQFLGLLDDKLPVTTSLLDELVTEAGLDAVWAERLKALVGEVEVAQIEAKARQLGVAWFADVREEESAA